MRTKEENSGMKSNFLHIFARLVYDPKTHLSCVFWVLLIRLTIRLIDFHSFGMFFNSCKYHFLPFFRKEAW